MTTQSWIGVGLVLGWMISGIFNIISGYTMMLGLVGFMIGVWLTTWENKCVNHAEVEGGKE